MYQIMQQNTDIMRAKLKRSQRHPRALQWQLHLFSQIYYVQERRLEVGHDMVHFGCLITLGSEAN